MLEDEQNRIRAKLDHLTRRIDAHHGEYTDARAHLDDALNPARTQRRRTHLGAKRKQDPNPAR